MKRLILWSAGILAVSVLAVILAFKLSPWPSVAIFSYLFSKGDQASEVALAKYVPADVVTHPRLAGNRGTE